MDREQAYDGPQIVGIDLHARRSVLLRMTPDGQRLGRVRIDNSPAALKAEVAKAGPNPKVVLEATYGWYWAADALAEAGAEVHLAHPLGVKMFTYRRVKTDDKDAADLADLLRMGRLPEAWIAPPRVRELRELVRYRHKLLNVRTSVKTQVHAVLAKAGLHTPMPDLFGRAGGDWLAGISLQRPVQPTGWTRAREGMTGSRACPPRDHTVGARHTTSHPLPRHGTKTRAVFRAALTQSETRRRPDKTTT
ncbi:IS110 family transposase [Streptomyces dysideae]|uniref:Transposase IS110-like N-terminal domain-containing protein n=1 Tax=Streptomyces dysideae TaxID=909626 RepID=A0A117RW45_9ACTN|nr:transposase [Streptomyces dysideae]KUO12842.1 hypothetical protein AQJ91_47960 [Streptomyces dysideae]